VHRFLLFGVSQYVVSNHTLPRFDFNCADGLSVFIPAYAAASAFVACCVSTVTTLHKSLSSSGHSRLLTTLIHQLNCQLFLASRYIASGRNTQKTYTLPGNGCPVFLRIDCRGMFLLSRCLAMGLCVTLLPS
jgi:hypothetical protein